MKRSLWDSLVGLLRIETLVLAALTALSLGVQEGVAQFKMPPRRPPIVTCIYNDITYKSTVEKAPEESYCEEGTNLLGQEGLKLRQLAIKCTCEGKVKEQRGDCPDKTAPCPPELSKSSQFAVAPSVQPVGDPHQYFVVGKTDAAKAKCEADAKAYVANLPCKASTIVIDNGMHIRMGELCKVQQKTECTKQEMLKDVFTCEEDPDQPNKKYCCSEPAEGLPHCKVVTS